jgi:GT2 family glycosyltransferase
LFGSVEITPYFHHLIKDGQYYTEDYSFCIRAAQAGFRIGIDTEPRIFHKGWYAYGLEDIASQVQRVETLNVNLAHVQEL